MNILQTFLEKISEPIYKKRGFYQDKIIKNWHLIIGEDLFNKTIPSKIAFSKKKDSFQGKLEIYVKDNSSAIEIQYLKEYIIEKIAIYLGYKAINEIYTVLNQAVFLSETKNCETIEKYKISDGEHLALMNKVKNIDDQILKQSLYHLGKLVIINDRKSNHETEY